MFRSSRKALSKPSIPPGQTRLLSEHYECASMPEPSGGYRTASEAAETETKAARRNCSWGLGPHQEWARTTPHAEGPADPPLPAAIPRAAIPACKAAHSAAGAESSSCGAAHPARSALDSL